MGVLAGSHRLALQVGAVGWSYSLKLWIRVGQSYGLKLMVSHWLGLLDRVFDFSC